MSKEMSYEEAQVKLNEIIEKMQGEKTTLEESIELYKEASMLIAYMRKKLDEVSEEVEKLSEASNL